MIICSKGSELVVTNMCYVLNLNLSHICFLPVLLLVKYDFGWGDAKTTFNIGLVLMMC
jgi:hypothetical protein